MRLKEAITVAACGKTEAVSCYRNGEKKKNPSLVYSQQAKEMCINFSLNV